MSNNHLKRYIFFLCLVSSIFSQNTSELIEQLQQQKMQAIEKLLENETEAKNTIPLLKKIADEALDENKHMLFFYAMKAIRMIEQNSRSRTNFPFSRSSLSRTRSIAHQNTNIGGITILGSSQDFRQRLKYGKRHALVVGINKYQHYTPLSAPNFDAAAVASILSSRYGFENVVYLCDEIPKNIYSTEELVLKKENVNQKTYTTKYGTEKIIVATNYIKKSIIQQHLDHMCSLTGENDALLFFYAGHGTKGAIIAANSQDHSSNLPLKEVAEKLSNSQGRHILMVLDSCFSGSILQEEFKPELKGYKDKYLAPRIGENIDRVFSRRAFQVITAGTGSEVVADKLGVSTKYAELTKAGEHSPFSAVFIQALKGLTGREDGIQLASDLGYYMTTSLVNDKRLEASQTPRYTCLSGNGDFMFFPKTKVLNPKLIAPLYLDEESYQEIRASTCEALKNFILHPRHTPKEQLHLTKNALTHVIGLLSATDAKVQFAGVKFVHNVAQKFVVADVEEFRNFVSPISRFLHSQTRKLVQKRHQETENMAHVASLSLKLLSIYANNNAVDSLKNYVQTYQKPLWENSSEDYFLPPDIKKITNKLLGDLPSGVEKQLLFWALKNDTYHTLNTQGISKILSYDKMCQKIVQDAEVMLKQAEKSYNELMRILSKQQNEKQICDLQEIETLYEEFGAIALEAIKHIRKVQSGKLVYLKKLQTIRKKCSDLVLLSLKRLHSRVVWKTPTFGHQEAINAVAQSKCRKFLASAAENQTVILWDVTTGKKVHILSDSELFVGALAFSNDGRVLASGTEQGKVKLWDTLTGKEKTLVNIGFQIHCFAFSADDKYLVVGGEKTVVIDLATEKQRNLEIKQRTFSTCFLADQQQIAFGLQNGQIVIYDTKLFEKVHSLHGHKRSVTSLDYHLKNKTLASGSADKTIKIWRNDKCEQTLYGHSSRIMNVKFRSDGKFIVSGSSDQTIKIWNLKNNTPQTLRGHSRSVNFVAYSPNENHIISSAFENIHIWEIKSARELRKIPTHTGAVFSIDHAPQEKMIISGGIDRTLKLWNSEDGSLITTLKGHREAIDSVSYNRQKKTIASSSRDGNIFIWSKESHEIIDSFHFSPSANHVKYDPSGKYLVASLENGTIKIWENHKLVRNIKKHSSPIVDLVCLENKIISADENTIYVWDLKNGQQQHIINDYHNINALAYDESSKTMAIGFNNGSIILLRDGEKIVELEAHDYFVSSLLFNNNHLISVSQDDDTICIWDLNTHRQIAKLKDDYLAVLDIKSTHNGKYLISAGLDGTIRKWNIFFDKSKVKKFTSAIKALDYHPKQKLICGLENQQIYQWQPQENFLRQIDKNTPLNSICYDDRGNHVAYISKNKMHIHKITAKNSTESFSHTKALVEQTGDSKVTIHFPATRTSTVLSTDLHVFSFCISYPLIALGSLDGSIEIWNIGNIPKPKKIATFPAAHKYTVRSLAISPTKKILASGSDDDIQLWNIENKQQMHTFLGHSNSVKSLTFDSQEKYLISGAADKTIRVWDIQKQRPLYVLREHTDSVESLIYIKDQYLISASNDKTIRLWNLPSHQFTIHSIPKWLLHTPTARMFHKSPHQDFARWFLQTLQESPEKITCFLYKVNVDMSLEKVKKRYLWYSE
ncbi:caspase family protein [Candidatus Uabimicrobium amorphum]|uniref:Peptidase C14 caspase domain-containing protein n=1 Tax=Uabimicrobium amorphum TaxID=2596890 RepID=A0A5S9IR77_UABAM|nr:caspase family protein [Candidatus Uabimicrobium amorphum]BBM86146.1 hypothetical protein UABAM_04532 [Candidatus Uabimicrobium amorphum]